MAYLRKFQKFHLASETFIHDLSPGNKDTEAQGADSHIRASYEDEDLFSIDEIWTQTFENLVYALKGAPCMEDC